MKTPPDLSGTRLHDVARHRIRSLREARGWTLNDLAQRSQIGASTLSRLETGQRKLTLEHISDLARALLTTADALISTDDTDDVVIHPAPTNYGDGSVHWPLTRGNESSDRVVTKMLIPAADRAPEPQVHPGREWFYVIDGTARLVLGDRQFLVETGRAAEFDTMTPHCTSGYGGPAEILIIFDHHGERVHYRTPIARTT